MTVPETAFVSTEAFTQPDFKRWVARRPRSDVNHYELIHGRIVMTPPAGWEHAEIGARIVRFLGNFVAENDLGYVFDSSAGYDLPSGDTVEPDASYISHERWARGPHVRRGQFLKTAPTLAVEILSTATARRDRVEKKAIYEANGVDEYWLVDPRRREVVVFRLVRGKYTPGTRYGPTRMLRSGVFPSLALPVRSLFSP